MIDDGIAKIPDKRFWQQAQNFMNLSGGKMGSAVGFDDLVIAVAGVFQLLPEAKHYIPHHSERRVISKFEEFKQALNEKDDEYIEKVFREMKVKVLEEVAVGA